MTFTSQLFAAQNKKRNKVPKKGTIAYCNYMIAKAEASLKPRVDKQAIIRRFELKIEAIRDAKTERAADNEAAIKKKHREEIEVKDAVIALLKDEVKRLQSITGMPGTIHDHDPMAALIAAVKTLGCSLNGNRKLCDMRHMLPQPFDQWSKRKLYAIVDQLIHHRKLSRLPGGLII